MGLLSRKKAPEPEPELDGPAPTMLELVSDRQPAAMIAALAAGGGVDAVDSSGWSCLHHAASLGTVPHVEALLDAGADTGIATAAPFGSFAKGMTPIDVAQQVQRTGQGDRDPVVKMLFLGAQAKGWGNWRDLQQVDASSPRAKAPKPLGADHGSVTRQSTARDGGVGPTESEEEMEARIRRQLRSELAVRDARAKAAEQELAEVGEKCAQAEGQLTVAQKKQAALENKCAKLKEKATQGNASGKQVAELTASLKNALEMLAAAEVHAAEWEGLASAETSARALDMRRAADAAAALEKQRRHGVANKAIRRIMHVGIGRAFKGWAWMLSEHRRRRALLARAAARFAKRSLACAFDAWDAWARRSKVDLQAALEAAEARTRHGTATKVRERSSTGVAASAFLSVLLTIDLSHEFCLTGSVWMTLMLLMIGDAGA